MQKNRQLKNGYIKLYRSITSHPLWLAERFTKAQAWVDLLLLAAHEPHDIMDGLRRRRLLEGQIMTSQLALAERWGWSRKSVTLFLDSLSRDGMLKRDSTNRNTVITIMNYHFYQKENGSNIPTKEQPIRSERPTAERQNRTYNNEKTEKKGKNEKNEKNAPEKQSYAPAVSMSRRQYAILTEKYGEGATKRYIEKLNNYKLSSGKTYTDDYHAILSWVVRRVQLEDGEENKNATTLTPASKPSYDIEKIKQRMNNFDD